MNAFEENARRRMLRELKQGFEREIFEINKDEWQATWLGNVKSFAETLTVDQLNSHIETIDSDLSEKGNLPNLPRDWHEDMKAARKVLIDEKARREGNGQ